MARETEGRRGFYFENDIGMTATALTEMFGAEVEARVRERLDEVRRDGHAERVEFWETVLDEVQRRSQSNAV